MVKKILILLLVLMIPASLMATSLIQMGVIANYNAGRAVDLLKVGDGIQEILLNPENYDFGAEVRINPVSFISIAAPVTFGMGTGMEINTTPSVNFNLPMSWLLDIAVGVGMNLSFTQSGNEWLINGEGMSSAVDVLLNSQLLYRAAITVNLAVFSVGISAMVPTEDTFSNFSFTPDWESTKVSVSALLNFF